MKDIATFIGTFFFNSLFDIGITAQSHAGIKNPSITPTMEPKILFWGINFSIVSFDT